MPTKTFLNLPDEKQKHLLESAIKEFTKHTLMESSINKIIQEANIPRGSFYQYFESKEDLYFYVFDIERKTIMEEIQNMINPEDCISDIFLNIYDYLYRYIVDSKSEEYYKNVMITFHRLEESPKEKGTVFDETITHSLKKRVCLLEEDAISLLEVMSFALSKSIIDSLKNKQEQPQIRKKFQKLLEIFKNGYEEEIK